MNYWPIFFLTFGTAVVCGALGYYLAYRQAEAIADGIRKRRQDVADVTHRDKVLAAWDHRVAEAKIVIITSLAKSPDGETAFPSIGNPSGEYMEAMNDLVKERRIKKGGLP